MLQYGDSQPDAMLSHIPWRIEVTSAETKEQHADRKKEENSEGSGQGGIFLPESFLDLRRQQNLGWAEERLVEGIALSKATDTLRQAEEAYKKGLEIVPEHTDLLTAYGALLANQDRTKEALGMLEKALGVDPNHSNAKTYQQAILDRLEATEAHVNTRAKHNLAYFKDHGYPGEQSDDAACLENTQETGPGGIGDSVEGKAEGRMPAEIPFPAVEENKYPLLLDDDAEEEQSSDDESSGHHRRKHKRRKRKRRRKKEKKAKKEKKKKK